MPSIYALRNDTSTDVYVGSTKHSLAVRFKAHLKDSKRPCPSTSSATVMACPTARIELLETCEEAMLNERERFWIRTLGPCVNRRLPARKGPPSDPAAEIPRAARCAEVAAAWRLANPEAVAFARASYLDPLSVLAQKKAWREAPYVPRSKVNLRAKDPAV